MVDFAQSVNAPGAASYTPPKVDSSWISNLYDNFVQGQTDIQKKTMNDQSIAQNKQQQQLNDQRIQAGQQQAQLAKAFPNGLPVDPATGGIDYRAVASTLAKFGDVGTAVNIAQQQPAPPPPLIAGGTSSPQQGQPAPQGQPASIPAKPLPPPAANSPQGDAGQGTVTSMVTDKLPSQNQTTGATIMKIAETMGVDPNANLTPGQQRRAQGLLKQYAPDIAGSGNLPPSAAAASPAPPPAPPPAAPQQGAPNGAGSPQQQPPAQPQPGAPPPGAPAPAAAPQQQQQPQPQQQGAPLTLPVALPKGFTDPQKAIDALRADARRLAGNPKTAVYAEQESNWADQIEKSIAPMTVHPGQMVVNPKTRETLLSAPSASGGQAGQLVRLENAERAARGEPAMTAQEEISFIQGIHPPRSAPAMALEAFRKEFQEKNGRPPNGDEMKKFAGEYAGETAYGRTAGSQGARVESASNEVEQLIPQAVEASKNYTRQGGKWVKLNEIYQAWDRGQGDEKYNDFMLANFSLINSYTRAMNPQGVPHVNDRLEQHALGVLSTATSEKTYETQIRRLWKEVQASKTATAKTAEGRSRGDINSPVPGLDTPASTPGAGGKPAADGSTVYTLPNGSKARVQKVD